MLRHSVSLSNLSFGTRFAMLFGRMTCLHPRLQMGKEVGRPVGGGGSREIDEYLVGVGDESKSRGEAGSEDYLPTA